MQETTLNTPHSQEQQARPRNRDKNQLMKPNLHIESKWLSDLKATSRKLIEI